MKAKNVFLGIAFFTALFIIIQSVEDRLILIAVSVLLAFYIITSILRYKIWMQPFLKGPYSFYHGKYKKRLTVDLPADLLFQSIEAFYSNKKGYKVNTYPNQHMIVVGTPFSWLSWSENIIITIRKLDDNKSSELDFTSVAFSVYTWAKNQDNFKDLQSHLNQLLVV